MQFFLASRRPGVYAGPDKTCARNRRHTLVPVVMQTSSVDRQHARPVDPVVLEILQRPVRVREWIHADLGVQRDRGRFGQQRVEWLTRE